MKNKLYKISLPTAVWMSVIFYSLAITIQTLVITRVIPYNWVNGGFSESYDAQLALSINSIVLLVVMFVLTLIAGNVIKTKLKKTITIICWIMSAYWLIGLIMQLIGTPFERFVISWTILLGLISSLRLAIEKN